MRAARVIVLITLMVTGLASTSFAQYSNATGTFPAKIGVVPGLLPDGGASLPPELQSVGPDLFVGTLIISGGGGSDFTATFQGERVDGAKLNVVATFASNWAGVKIGGFVVGSKFEPGLITGIDVAHLLRANINGVGTVDGGNQRVIAKVGPGGTVDKFLILPAPGPLR